ncbi:MAG: hypothetical protein RI980_422 [Bacteroidota bacterium]|jgi:hypothetical protein
MGTWNNKINGNDTFQDIYQNFFDLYNQGQNPIDISKQIQDDFAEMFDAYDDRNNSLFGLALAQWETKSLDQTIFKQVKEIIETGNELEIWKGLGADEKTLQKRKKELERFLSQISTEREKPKRRIRPKFEFEMINLVDAVAPDNLKKFGVNEEYTNKQYVHTSGLMMWGQGGGSVLYFTGQGKKISATWLDSKTLEVTHDKDIVFSMQDNRAYFCGDDIKIIYKPQ